MAPCLLGLFCCCFWGCSVVASGAVLLILGFFTLRGNTEIFMVAVCTVPCGPLWVSGPMWVSVCSPRAAAREQPEGSSQNAYQGLFGIWVFLHLSGPIWTHLGQCGHIWACSGLSGHMWPCWGPSGPIWVIWDHLGLCGPIGDYLGLSGKRHVHIHIYMKCHGRTSNEHLG